MPTKKRKKANEKVKTLATKSLSAKKSGVVKGGSSLFTKCATGKHYDEAKIIVR